MFSLSSRVRSIGYALRGLGFVLRTQQNAWIHLAATGCVVGVGLWLRIREEDWRWVAVAIGLVWVAEIFNTAFEHLCDVVQPEFHTSVKAAKDVAAGAVLVAAAVSALIGLLVFLPYLKI